MKFLSQSKFAVWLSTYHGYVPSFGANRLTHVLDFTLLWNIFERDVCGMEYEFEKVCKTIDNAKLDLNDFAEPLAYFRKRYRKRHGSKYTEENLANDLLGTTRQTKPDKKGIGLLFTVLKSPDALPPQCVKALVFLAYRVRCNLFHGEKHFGDLPSQEPLFNAVNSTLQRYLESCAHPVRGPQKRKKRAKLDKDSD